jgi:hypothetical protein
VKQSKDKKRSRMRYPKPLSDLMSDTVSSMGLAGRLQEAEIWRLWPEIVGQAIASQAQPVRIINGVLTVAVSSAPWMQELSYLKGMMITKLNSALGSVVVREIILRSGKVARQVAELDEPMPTKKELTQQQLVEIEQQAAAIGDPETRAAFIELMKASFASRK